MAEVVRKNLPLKDASQAPCTEDAGKALPLTSPRLQFSASFEDALRLMSGICPKGAIVVLLGVPDDARNQTLSKLNSEVKDGKRIWSVKDAQKEVMNSPQAFLPAEKFVINGYSPLLGGLNREQAFQLCVAKKCKTSPAFVLTTQWPDPATLGKGTEQVPFNFAWAQGFFTQDSEVLCIRYDEHSKTFEIGRGALASEGERQFYRFSHLASDIPVK